MQLAVAYQARNPLSANRKTVIKAEYDAALRVWQEGAISQKVKYKAYMLSLNRSADAANEYLRTEFEAANPQFRDLEFPPGRPEGYVGPKKRFALAQGAVITLLLERCGKDVLKELSK